MLPLNPFDRSPAPRHGLPLARGRFPKLGHLPAMIWDLPALCRWAHSHYGPCAWLDRGGGNLILQVAGDDTFEVLKNKQVDSSALYEAAPTFLGRSMIVMDGPDHRRVRGATGQAFTPSGLDRAKVGAIIAEVVTARVEGWPSQRELMVARQTREMALEIIFRIIGIPPHDVPTWRHMFEELTLSAVNIPFDLPGSPARRGKRAATWLDARMRRIIEERVALALAYRLEREARAALVVDHVVHGPHAALTEPADDLETVGPQECERFVQRCAPGRCDDGPVTVRAKGVARIVLSLIFLVVGVGHFVAPEPFVAIMPPYLPYPLELVYLSGVFEIALGLLVHVERIRRPVGWALVALLLAVFPANLQHALDPPPEADIGIWAYVRLPFQLVFIAWALWVTKPDGDG